MAKKKKEVVTPQRQESDKQKQAAVKMAMEQIEKQYGKGSIMKLGEKSAKDRKIGVISTGSIALDLALGVGGLGEHEHTGSISIKTMHDKYPIS